MLGSLVRRGRRAGFEGGRVKCVGFTSVHVDGLVRHDHHFHAALHQCARPSGLRAARGGQVSTKIWHRYI